MIGREQRARPIAERGQRQARAAAIVDHLPADRILEVVAATGPRLRAKWKRHQVETCDLAELDVNARVSSLLREREEMSP